MKSLFSPINIVQQIMFMRKGKAMPGYDDIREELKNLTGALKVLVLVEEGMDLSGLKLQSRDRINSMAPFREVPQTIEKGWLLVKDDESVCINQDKIKELFKGICGLLNLKGDNEKLEIANAMWQEIKEHFFEMNPYRESSLLIKNQNGIVAREEVEVYPYFPDTIPGCLDRRVAFFSKPKLLNVEGIKKINVKEGSKVLDKIRIMRRDVLEDKENDTPLKKDEEYLKKRKEAVREILSDRNLNEVTKLSEYAALTNIDPLKKKLLLAAVQYGIKAEKMIMFLEEPEEDFNFEVIEEYITHAANTESASRALQLARDLVDGRWSIEGEDGRIYRVYPEELIDRLGEIIKLSAKEDLEDEYGQQIKHGGKRRSI